MASIQRLVLVEDSREVAASHQAFVRELAKAKNLAMDLVRRTRYWVYEPTTRTFSPSKFSGYVAMDFQRYDAARDGDSTGVKFDSGVTQRAISHVLGDYQSDADLAHMLREWAEATFGEKVLEGVEPGKWRFVRLPATGAGGLAALAGGWEGSDELVDSVLELRRSSGRVAPDMG
jgi:hypothetical protein